MRHEAQIIFDSKYSQIVKEEADKYYEWSYQEEWIEKYSISYSLLVCTWNDKAYTYSGDVKSFEELLSRTSILAGELKNRGILPKTIRIIGTEFETGFRYE